MFWHIADLQELFLFIVLFELRSVVYCTLQYQCKYFCFSCVRFFTIKTFLNIVALSRLLMKNDKYKPLKQNEKYYSFKVLTTWRYNFPFCLVILISFEVMYLFNKLENIRLHYLKQGYVILFWQTGSHQHMYFLA